jgi:hypothetical protein
MRLPALIEQGRGPSEELLAPDQTTDVPARLIERVELSSDGLHVTCAMPTEEKAEPLSLGRFILLQIKRRGIEMKLVINAANPAPKAAPSLLRTLAGAHRWMGEIMSGAASSVAEIAGREGITEPYVGNVPKLAFLAPDITAAIISGNQPVEQRADLLIKDLDLPPDWRRRQPC